jgi:hypothetical protein
MLSLKVEKRVTVKFLAKLGKSATETYNLLMEVYGDECLSHTQVFEWFKKFKEGREEIKDNPRTGWPCTSKTDANTEKVGEIVRKNRCLSIRAVAELANIDKESVQHILHEKFNLKGGKTAHGFFTMTTHRLSRCFWRSTRTPCWNIHPTHLT